MNIYQPYDVLITKSDQHLWIMKENFSIFLHRRILRSILLSCNFSVDAYCRLGIFFFQWLYCFILVLLKSYRKYWYRYLLFAWKIINSSSRYKSLITDVSKLYIRNFSSNFGVFWTIARFIVLRMEWNFTNARLFKASDLFYIDANCEYSTCRRLLSIIDIIYHFSSVALMSFEKLR